ncbi:hypothetical protein [Nocardioides campestrisoli]|uniref:hypothetical protein n=1 Tax=Nocardioides campestrisoli TaxID=2736757 RepID=UPI00163D9BBD|nr:hypothetical protein [Nocardioides campestrisoli]
MSSQTNYGDDSPRGIASTRRFKVGYLEGDSIGHTYVITTDDGATWLLDPERNHAVCWPDDAGDGRAWKLVTADWLAVGHGLTLLVRGEQGNEHEVRGGEVVRIVEERHSQHSRR